MGGGPGLLDPQRVTSRARQENFPVASRLLPRAARGHLMAVYGFARLVDDAGDEAPGDRGELLDRIASDLDRAVRGTPDHPLLRSLARTIHEIGLPRDPFQRLIEANRRDQAVRRYETFDDLVGYCELSANPVGHLVLLVSGMATSERLEWSDAICTGLQLTEHWQDIAEDAQRGRVYLPQEDLRRFGCSVDDLRAGRVTPEFRSLLAFEVSRAHALLTQGLPLAGSLGGRMGYAVAAYVAGGRAALAAIERSKYDVLTGTPRPSRAERGLVLGRTLVEARVRRRAA